MYMYMYMYMYMCMCMCIYICDYFNLANKEVQIYLFRSGFIFKTKD